MKRVYFRNILFASVLGLLPGCGDKETPPPPPPTVEAHTVAAESIAISIPAIGTAKAFDKVDLVARVQGFIRKRNFKEGEYLKKDSVLFEIEPEEYEIAVKAAQAELDQAIAKQRNTQSEYERQKKLLKEETISVKAMENASTAKLNADAGVKSAEANLEKAKLNLSYTKIDAPFDGMVGLSSKSEGNLVSKESGTLATMLRLNPMRVEFTLSELDFLQFEKHRRGKGENVVVRIAFQNGEKYPRTGRISYWDNRLSTATGTLKLQALFDNPNFKLIDGMFLRVSLEPKESASHLLVPRTAVMSDLTGDYVYLVGADNTVVRRGIKLGFKATEMAVAESGLQAGDKVIVSGLQMVRPGMKVNVKEVHLQENAAAPTTAPAPNPPTAPVTAPTTVPVQNPPTAPVPDLTIAPVQNPTTAPITDPAAVPVEKNTEGAQ